MADLEAASLVANAAGAKASNFLHDQHLLDMKTWFTDGPVTFKYLALIGGALMMVCGFFGVLGGLLNPLEGVIEAYVMLFGALIVAIELKNKLFKDEFSDETGELIQQHKFKTILAKEAKFLTVLAGRGYFYIFVGSLLVTQGAWSFEGMLGMYMMLVGFMQTVVGMHAKAKLSKMAGHVKDEAEVRKLFKAADKDRSGSLTPVELAKLCKSLGSELDSNQLEAAISRLDFDGTGLIKYGEFYTWWKGTAGWWRP
mmetsp:Transcript_93006/g.265544  ORF Transcript_93006/g.265544 Transcript_93006/m.265544 type:complete len:255 (+) Transcript_93006:173-937(+)